ncbi:MAG: ABC transporter permease [Phycisphaerae bacterium]|nr:ABC transporter permease [Phycisphaerae bacterium]
MRAAPFMAWVVAWAIALKDLRLLVRDKADAFFTFVFPVLLAIFFGVLFRPASERRDSIELAIVDECACEASTSFVAALDADTLIHVTPKPTREEAEALVRRGDALASIVLPKDFAEGADRMFAGGGIAIEAVVDPSREAESSLLVGKLNEIAFRQLGQAFGDPKRMTPMLDNARTAVSSSETLGIVDKTLLNGVFESLKRLTTDRSTGAGDPLKNGPFGGAGWSPATVTVTKLASSGNGPPSSYAVTFPQGIAWVLMSSIAAFAASIARERDRGTMLRLSVAPISRATVLFGKALGCFLTCAIGITILLVVARVGFGVTIDSFPMLVVAIAMASAAGAGVMMVISGVFRTQASAEGAGRAIVLILAMIGGGTIPLAFMPPFMQIVSSFSPFKWAIAAVEGAVWRGFSPTEMAQPLGVLAAITAVGAVAGFLSIRRGEA